MAHICEYCKEQINKPCAARCIEKTKDPKHVCCTCNINEESCELPQRVVCSKAACNANYMVDFYKLQLEELQSNHNLTLAENYKLKALNNQFRIANIGSRAAMELIENGTINVANIKLFVSQQRATIEDLDAEHLYLLMTLHESFAEMYSQMIREKFNKVNIKRELIEKTQNELDASAARQAKIAKENKAKAARQISSATNLPKVKLTFFEERVRDAMNTFGMNQTDAINGVRSMPGMPQDVECRDLVALGVIKIKI